MSEPRNAVYKTPVIKKNQPDDNNKFQSLPAPTGMYPFHMNIDEIVEDIDPEKIVLHMVGDTGSLRNPCFTLPVATAMTEQYHAADPAGRPRFLYHLGDVVYNHGETTEYDRQFFIPYQHYPGPIVAIAGNHDSDVNPEAAVPYESLSPFVKVFCAASATPVDFSLVKNRLSMTQPNVYWVLHTPLAVFIGLHSNVPKFGIVTPQQRSWFVQQLRDAATRHTEKMLIVCIHHSPYSADINHGASLAMIDLLEGAFDETGVRPDVVFSGHVHNYQRFLKSEPDGTTSTYVVAGAGGYDELHPLATLDNPEFTNDDKRFNKVKLISWCDDKHGFLKLSIEKKNNGIRLTGEYFSFVNERAIDVTHETELTDRFVVERSI